MKRAIFPGSFDPLTLGHCEIIKKAEDIFDEIIIAVGINDEKKYQFSIDQRLKFIENEFLGNSKIIVDKYQQKIHTIGWKWWRKNVRKTYPG